MEWHSFFLPKAEYAKIVSEINTVYGKYKGEKYCMHCSFGIDDLPYRYYFINYGYNDYIIYLREFDD
ncbi:MAG: hypothetical protein K6F92_06525 [Lachnospiraceae bacterium]|nr:hypothetical protein [Lachnospiraceae bacterium]